MKTAILGENTNRERLIFCYTLAYVKIQIEIICDILHDIFFGEKTPRPFIQLLEEGKTDDYGYLACYEIRVPNNFKKFNTIYVSLHNNDGNPLEVASTLLHELVHHYNACRGIQDHSPDGLHNEAFRVAAEAHGLLVYEDEEYGYETELNPETKKYVYDQLIAFKKWSLI